MTEGVVICECFARDGPQHEPDFVAAAQNERPNRRLTQAWGRATMAGFRCPRRVRIMDGFERIGITAGSRIQKNRLREPAIDL